MEFSIQNDCLGQDSVTQQFLKTYAQMTLLNQTMSTYEELVLEEAKEKK